MNVADFDFALPSDLIAQTPPPRRTDARLLVLDRGTGRIEHSTFARIGRFLQAGDLLVVNDTRVFPARLLGRRVPSGGAVECLLLSPAGADQEPEGIVSPHIASWDALVHPGQKLKPGARIVFESAGVRLHGEIVSRHFHGRRIVRLWTDADRSVADAIEAIGHVPLPPYIARPDETADLERYQTVYARERGSVAAPTAGLHFTQALLDDLAARGIERTAVTLHVGYGTFKPVRVPRVEDHVVDPERFAVSPAAAASLTAARQAGQRIVAVGTTTTRALESLPVHPDGRVDPTEGDTPLFIHPGHRFRLVDALVTNFHLPRSSLLMLVSAFAGRDLVLGAYREAVARRYRFYSYGDAMLVL
jgi:S-adenosylmethionine:tRNA ribosyltransferase-isomerase